MDLNKIVYSCDTSDEGSDMDVSDIEDNSPPVTQVQTTTTLRTETQTTHYYDVNDAKPHQGMVTSLHRYMQRDSWGKDAIKPMAEKKRKNIPVIPDPNSYAAIASRSNVPDTLPNTTASSAQLERTPSKWSIDPDEDEGSMSDDSFHTAPSSPSRIEEIFVQSEFEPGQLPDPPTNDELLERMREIEKSLEENEQVANQIKARLREIAFEKEKIRIRRLKNQVHNSLARNRKTNVVQKPQPPSVVDKGKAPMEPRHVDKGKAPMELRNLDQGRAPMEPEATDNENVPESTEDIPKPKEMIREDDLSKDSDDDSRSSRSPSPSPPYNNLSNAEKKKMLLMQLESEISPEEQELIRPDCPPYVKANRAGCGKLVKEARRIVAEHLKDLPTFKTMRLMLMNCKEASTRTTFGFQQEEFTKELIKKILEIVECFRSIDEETYNLAKNEIAPGPIIKQCTLPDVFYGDVTTLDRYADDVSNYEIYKCIKHFEDLTNHGNLKRARRYLLKSAEEPLYPVQRELDPTDPNSDVFRDEDLPVRLLNTYKELKAKKKSKKKQEAIAAMKRRITLDEENSRLEKDIERLSFRINADLRSGKRRRVERVSPSEDEDDFKTKNDKCDAQLYLQAKARGHSKDKDTTKKDTKKKVCFAPKKPSKTTKKRKNAKKAKLTKQPKQQQPKKIQQAKAEPSIALKTEHELDILPVPTFTLPSPPTSKAGPSASTANYGLPSSYKPYRSALSSLGLKNTSHATNKSSALCSAESAGGVCNVKDCSFTHFKDFM